MDAAIRWSINTDREPRFLIADAAGRRLRLCEPSAISGNAIEYKKIALLDKLPEFTAFDWSPTDENLAALGTFNGEARVVQLDASNSASNHAFSFPIKQTRECNSIAFSQSNLLASALKKHRTDSSLNVYDIGAPNSGPEPYRRLANGDAVANVKFFPDRPHTLLAGIYSKGLRLYDLRDSNPAGAGFISTRQCHFLSIDYLDENYFAAAGPPGESIVCIWDRRAFSHSSAANLSVTSLPGAALEMNDIIDTHRQTTIRTLRFSGTTRGRFAVLSSAGQLRQFDIAQNRPVILEHAYQHDEPGNDISDSFHYVKRSHDLQYPSFHKAFGQEESATTIAFDWAHPGSLANSHGIVHMRRNGDLEFLRIAPIPPIVKFTARNEVAFHLRATSSTRYVCPKGTIAEELMQLQTNLHNNILNIGFSNGVEDVKSGTHGDKMQGVSALLGDPKVNKVLSSQERHEQLLGYGTTKTRLNFVGLLTTMDTQRRRCEEGYLFDCDVNKLIVKNDPWLVDLWDFIKRLKNMTGDGGMISGRVDLSYLGVDSIWSGNVEQLQKRSTSIHSISVSEYEMAFRDILTRRLSSQYNGVATEFPYRRQLGLIMCGWKFSERRLRSKCTEILERGEYYKAIVVAFCHGQKLVAIDMLKIAITSRAIDNSGLAAVIACETVSKEQKDLCGWMAEDAKDPYLKALLTYFTTGDWKPVTDMTGLPLMYRVAIALQHLDDGQLNRFLKTATKNAVRAGDIGGVVLTGLGEDSMDLFQNYIDKTSDLQTAVLVTAFANPRYHVDNERWNFWKEAYFDNMQSWRAFTERTRFTLQHGRMSIDRDGHKLIHPPPRQLTLRCNHCQKSIARIEGSSKHNSVSTKPGIQLNRPPNPGTAAGTVCPKCGRHLPRCSLCMLWLGTPDASTSMETAAMKTEDQMGKFINFCVHCGHGYHANHGREWFAKHQVCPVPSCKCMCAMRRT